MDQLLAVPEDEEINFLYSLIRQDAELFETFERKRFADTPLHLAAGEGRTQVALEIQMLMPSFGMKLNPDGFSPLDLALRRGHVTTVNAMIKLNPELVRVQGREGFTPLHYAAQIDDADMLAEFLLSCPCSIEELTIRGESAAHVAVKNRNLEAFKVLHGWLKRVDRMEVLRWRDFDGNTVLHLAASTNQPKVMELVIKHVDVKDKDFKGSTALDIATGLGPQVNAEVLQILQNRRTKRGPSIINNRPKYSTLAKYFSSPVSIFEKTCKLDAYLDMGLPGEMRNAILVVAVLMATAIYQAVLSPPGGLDDRFNTVSINDNDFLKFTTLNTFAFATSLAVIILVLPGRLYNLLLYISLLFFMIGYVVAVNITSPPRLTIYTKIITFASFSILCVIVYVKVHLMVYNVWTSRLSAGNRNLNFYEIRTLLFQSKYARNNSDGER